jgi:hypothetical protein
MLSQLAVWVLRRCRTEGDVEGIMEMPKGNDEANKRAREKWYVLSNLLQLSHP